MSVETMKVMSSESVSVKDDSVAVSCSWGKGRFVFTHGESTCGVTPQMPSGHFAPHMHFNMATCIALLNILAAQFISCYGLSSRDHLYNNNYYTPAYHLHEYKAVHKYQNQLKSYQHNNHIYFPRSKQTKHHQVVPIVGGGRHTPPNEHADRKITFYENMKPTKTSSSKTSPIKSLVLPKKQHDVTTKATATRELVSTARPTDNDVPIAIVDEDVLDEYEGGVTSGVFTDNGRRRPEHLNPLMYLDSYGKVHKRPGTDDVAAASVRDYGLERPGAGRVVVHHRPGRDYKYGYPAPAHHYKKHTGRVRMQVFRGPTRKYGRKRYAPWGYYVVQPSDDSYHYQHHYL